MADLNVPSNGRFTQDDLTLLWEAGAELARWKDRIALARATGTFGTPEVVAESTLMRDWRSLELCAHDAASLVNRWPSRVDRRSTWLPIGVPGGVEDVPLTAQEASERGFVMEVGDEVEITQSARWVGDRQPLRSTSVGAVAWGVIQLVRRSVPSDQLKLVAPLLNPIAAVAQMAATPAGHRDPDPSSWPSQFIAFVASCMRVIADLQSTARGRGVVPLLDTDELYEAWLAIQVREALDHHLGPQIEPDSDAICAWSQDDIVYQLWIKPSIPRTGRHFGAASYVALVAQLLTPDVMMTASRDDETATHILDAKSWATMLPEQALEQGAKYLYGIRRKADISQVPALAGVDLITSAPPLAAPDPDPDPDTSRIRVLSATPTRNVDRLHYRVAELADRLSDEIEARERLASAH